MGLKKNSVQKDIPEDIREQLKFAFMETIEGVLKNTLDINLPKPLFYSNDESAIMSQRIRLSKIEHSK